MAEAVIAAAVEVALIKAISILEDPINLAWDFKDELNKLRSSLALTRAFLQDAERRQLDKPVKLWLEQLSDVACKADDVLDELVYEHHRRKVDGQMSKKVRNFFSSKNPLSITLKMAKKVKNVSQSIEVVNSRATGFGLQNRVQVSPPMSSGVGGGTHSLVVSSRVVGREADVRRVVDLLIGSATHQTLSIASIVGMGGLGKTTLAKSNEDIVLREIQKVLKGKSFLLVLDDMWDANIKNWEELKGSLQGINESKQNWILVTSRSENVALVRETPPDHRHHLKAVVDEECWSIIKERAFGNSALSQELEAIGREIARRCGGVPLVATVIGATMYNNRDRDECSIHVVLDFKGLRVLKFGGADIKSLPDSIANLKHLRYFDISRTRIKRLPKSISQLYLLETLRLLMCHMLEQLPGGIKNLVNLRHLHISYGRHVPVEVGCLTSLQTLPVFKVGTERGRTIGELGVLVDLGGKLVISGLENVRNKEEARGARLWEKKKLQSLIFDWDDEKEGYGECDDESKRYGKDEEVLEGLEPHSNLKSLTIVSYKGECYPSWLVGKTGGDRSASFQPMNLVELKLFRCKNVRKLPSLGKYPNLKFLEIEGLNSARCTRNEFDMNGCDENKPAILFPALEVFTLCNMREVREWLEMEPAIPAFPSLKVLKIVNCHNLNSLPRMNRFSSLEKLKIVGCSQLGWIGDEPFSSSLKVLEIESCQNLRSIPSVEGGFSYLQQLQVKWCEELCNIGEGLLASTCLTDVVIIRCRNLRSISLDGGSRSLLKIRLEGCYELQEIEGGLSASTQLKALEIEHCPSMASIPSVDGLSSLSELKLDGCKRLTSLPSGLSTCTSLRCLFISHCSNLESIPEDVGQLNSLEELCIVYCGSLKRLPEESLGCLTGLKTLRLGPFSEELQEFPGLGSIHYLHSSLKQLRLNGWETLQCSLPHQLQHLTALEQLEIEADSGVVDDLEKILYVCAGMEHLEQRKSIGRKELRASDSDKACSGFVYVLPS
ncbi:hypothetical protein V6N13_024069 [Hibiscus sabdariffa]